MYVFQKEIRAPFLQSYFWHLSRAFAAIFRQIKVICTNAKRDSGKKFTSPEFCLPLNLPKSTGLPMSMVNTL